MPLSTLKLLSALLPLALATPLPQESLPPSCRVSDYGPQRFEFVKPKEPSLLGSLLGSDPPDINAFGTIFSGWYGVGTHTLPLHPISLPPSTPPLSNSTPANPFPPPTPDQATLSSAAQNATKNIALLSASSSSAPSFATDAKDPSIRSFALRTIDFACYAHLALTDSTILGDAVACTVTVDCKSVLTPSDTTSQTFTYGGPEGKNNLGGGGGWPAERVGRMVFDAERFRDMTSCVFTVDESDALLGTALLVDNVDYTLALCEVESPARS